MTQPISIKKLASSLFLGAAAWTFVCPPSPLAGRLCAQTAEALSPQTLDAEFAVAADYYAKQQWQQAANAFQNYINKRGQTQHVAAAKFFLGESYVQQNDFESAYQWYESFVRENPLNEFTARATFRMGESAWKTGQHDNALMVLEQFTQDYPNHDLVEFALPYLGKIRLNRTEPQMAKTAFALGLKLFPNSSMTLENQLGLGQSLQALGNLAAATERYSIVAASTDEADLKLVGQAKHQLGKLAFNQKDYSQAVVLLGGALKTCSGEAKIDCGYWLARAEMGAGDHEAAVELVSALVAASPESTMSETAGSTILYDGAVAASKIDRDELACIWLGKLQALYPESRLSEPAFALELQLHQQAGRQKRIIEMYESIAIESPASPNAMAATELAGRAFYSLGDYARTIETFHRLLKATAPDGDEQITSELRDQRANWLYLQSLGHLGLEQYDEALKELELADAYNQSPSMSALISLAQGTASFGQKQFSLAIPHYQGYLINSVDGDDATRAGCELALCYAELKQWDDALKTFAIMQEFGPDKLVTETTQYLAEKAYDANEKIVAEKFYLFMTSPSNSQAAIARGLSGLAWVNMESKDHLKALTVFKRLTEDYPDSKFSRNAVMSRAKFLEDAGFESEASDMYSLIISRFGSSSEASVSRLRQVALLQAMGGKANLSQARDLLKEQLQQSDSGSDDETLYQLGWVLTDLGKTDDGMDRFSRLVEQYPESKYWADAAFRIASQQIRDGKIEAATAMTKAILEKQNASEEIGVRTMLLKGQLAAQANDWPEVTRLMKRIKEKFSDNSSFKSSLGIESKATYWLAESLYQQELYNKSSQEFAAILDDNVLETNLQPWVRLRLAQCLGKLERWEDASNVAEDGLIKFSDFSHAHEYTFVKARAFETRGMLKDAQDLYLDVIESESGKGSETAAIAQWRIGEIHFHREDYSMAIESYQKVDALYNYTQWKKAAILQAGKCQEHLGNWKHASILYTQLMEKFPESAMAMQAKERLVLIERLAKNSTPTKSLLKVNSKRR